MTSADEAVLNTVLAGRRLFLLSERERFWSGRTGVAAATVPDPRTAGCTPRAEGRMTTRGRGRRQPRRRRAAAPTAASPANISAQVPGSGTG